MAGTLYLVGTPIGNLNDLSPRAIETLKSVDFIAAEDTRVTLKLLNHFGIRRPLISYYEHNKVESAAVILPRLLGGESCALVSDAGMPAISDPGEELVALCAREGVAVTAVPGPSAVVTAVAALAVALTFPWSTERTALYPFVWVEMERGYAVTWSMPVSWCSRMAGYAISYVWYAALPVAVYVLSYLKFKEREI